jgi:hypothetical protein
MGINNIDELKENNFKIKSFGKNYGVIFDDNKIELFEKYICETLENGFWNEYLGKDKVFIFKFKNGEIKRYILNTNNENEILKLCCEFAECEFESIDKMLRDNSFYAETYYAGNIIDNTFVDFLIRAKKSTYANSTIEKVSSSRVGSSDYNYEEIIDNKKYIYHDTYFGGIKFMGEEVVYCDKDKPIWGMNYYGITYDDALGEEAMDNALRPALMKVGEDRNIIPARGPIKFENNGYIYTFETTGTIENFDGIEQIYKDNSLIYELHCSGGIIK